MSEYVSKEELKEFFESIEITVAGRTRAEAIGEVLQAIYNGVMELPTTDAVPVRHGKWVPKYIKICGQIWASGMKCSECGEDALNAEGDEFMTDYCPQCGARMDEE